MRRLPAAAGDGANGAPEIPLRALNLHGVPASFARALDIVFGIVADAEEGRGREAKDFGDMAVDGRIGFFPAQFRADEALGDMFTEPAAIEHGMEPGVPIGEDNELDGMIAQGFEDFEGLGINAQASGLAK